MMRNCTVCGLYHRRERCWWCGGSSLLASIWIVIAILVGMLFASVIR